MKVVVKMKEVALMSSRKELTLEKEHCRLQEYDTAWLL
jgi:hypothetical protein